MKATSTYSQALNQNKSIDGDSRTRLTVRRLKGMALRVEQMTIYSHYGQVWRKLFWVSELIQFACALGLQRIKTMDRKSRERVTANDDWFQSPYPWQSLHQHTYLRVRWLMGEKNRKIHILIGWYLWSPHRKTRLSDLKM